MNTSDNMSLEYWEYDYNTSCEEDTSSGLSDASMVLLVFYYMLFGLGLLGMFKKASILKKKKENMPQSLDTF